MASPDAQDIADQLTRVRADLSARQSFIEALLETIEVGIVSCDVDGHFVVSNRAQRELFGLQSPLDGLWMGEIDPHVDVFDGDGRRLSPENYPLMRALQGEDASSVDVRVGPAGGPYREVLVRAAQITGPDGELLGAVAALTDVTAERTASRALGEGHRRLEEAQRIGQLGSFEHDFRADTWSNSAHLGALWGVEGGSLTPSVTAALVHEQDRQRAKSCWRAACRLGGHHCYEYRIHRAGDGVERWLRTDVEVDLDREGRPLLARGTQWDVTDVKTAEQAAKRANAFFDAVLTASPDYTFVTDVSTGAVIYGSRDKHVLGITTEQLTAMGDGAAEIGIHPEDRERLQTVDRAAVDLDDGSVLQIRYRGMHADGSWHWMNRRSTPFRRDSSGRVVEVLAVVRDVTDVVEAEDRLTYAAQHDHLTGLPNRGVLMERLEAALTRSERHGREVAVLFIDLDGFKSVNDSEGHAAGDAVLLETARRLTGALRGGDIVARVGGDEFAILVEPWTRPDLAEEDVPAVTDTVNGPDLAAQLAERIVQTLRRPVTVDGVDHVVTASIGVSYAAFGHGGGPGQQATADMLLRTADAAMYVAKSSGKDTVSVHQQPARAD